MKNIPTFDEFINEAKEYTFSIQYNTDDDDVEYIQNVLMDAGVDAIAEPAIHDSEQMVVKALNAIELRKAKKAIEADGFEIRESLINEDAGLIADVAIGVAVGIAGLWALAKGLPVVGNLLGDTAEALANKAEAKARQAAKGKRKELISEIIKKFEGDTRLKDMYNELVPYSDKMANIRRRQLTTIGNYIKAKLTPEEMTYFSDISSMLRTGDIR
jgi:hypothetical protein